MTRTMTVREFAGFARSLPPQLEAAGVRVMRSTGLRAVGRIVAEIDDAEPYPAVDTGALRQSVISEPIPLGAQVSVNAPQAVWMEYGTRPHMPPLGPILTWVTRKFGLGMGAAGRKKQRKARASKKLGPKPPPVQGPKLPPQQGPKKPPRHGPRMSPMLRKQRASMRFASEQQADAENLRKALAIANKIRWKIKHHGTKPRGFFAKAMHVVTTDWAPKELRRELKALERRLK